MPRPIHSCFFIILLSAVLCSCRQAPVPAATDTPSPIPASSPPPSITPTPSPTTTPAPPLPPELLDKLPEGYTITNGQLLDEFGVALGVVKVNQSGEGYQLAFTIPDASGVLQNYTADMSALVTLPTGALFIDSGEHTGFVWKGDKWAEILLQINFETDRTKFSEFSAINYEDITSGALAEAERLAAQPFPEDVQPLGNYYYDSNYGNIYPNFNSKTGLEFSLHPEKFPMRFVYFYQVKINNVPVVMATLQVLNKDYSSVFIHMVDSRKFLDSQGDRWNNIIQLQRSPIFDMALGGTLYDPCKDGWSDAVKQVCLLNTSQKTVLETAMQEWITEQKIPEELEQTLFVLESGRWY
jgi:hypothetical protein